MSSNLAVGIPILGFHTNYCASPNSLALSIGDTRVTYRELGDLVQGIRSGVERVVAHDARLVGVAGTQDIRTYASLLAVLASGRGYVPIPPSSPHDRNLDIIAQTGIDTILMSQPLPALQSACADRSIRVVDTSCIEGSPLTPPAAVGRDDLAYVLFTSGSTGKPKGVPIRHRNLDRFFRAMAVEFDGLLGPDDRFLQMFELSFDVSVMAFFYPLTLGASVHAVPPKRRRTSFDVLHTVQAAKITIATLVPSALSPLTLYGDDLLLPDVRVSILTGEGLAASLAQAWATCVPNARQFNLYGPTEATIWAGIYDYTDDLPDVVQDRGVVSIGRPFDGFTFRVVDASYSRVSQGQQGELCLAGEQVAAGYWNAPDLSARAFNLLPAESEGGSELYYCTGDYVREADRHFLYNGRFDDQVQVGGHRVELGEVEHHARRFLGDRPVVAVAKAQDEGFVQIVLCVEGADAAIANLMGDLRAALPPYMLPQRILAFQSFPLNDSGKIDKRRLRDLVDGADARDKAYGTA